MVSCKKPNNHSGEKVRSKIAREAAFLLYFGSEKEYKQAKERAAENFSVRILPSNLEVALELDKIAEENEGPMRTQRLIEMRKEALQIMKLLNKYQPLLIGSVWRGSIRRSSDIDISIYHDLPPKILTLLSNTNLKIIKTQRITLAKHKQIITSFHINIQTPTNYQVEITIRNIEEAGKTRVCDTFGDKIIGLNVKELEKLLQSPNPAKQFLPD